MLTFDRDVCVCSLLQVDRKFNLQRLVTKLSLSNSNDLKFMQLDQKPPPAPNEQ